MSETPKGLEPRLSVQPSSQPEPEKGLVPPSPFQLPVPTPDPTEARQQDQVQSGFQPGALPQQQLPGSNPELLQVEGEAEPQWIKHRRRLSLLFLIFCSWAGVLGLIYYMHHNLQTRSHNQGAPPCLSLACQLASAHLSMTADPFTQPCDYFLFSCGSDRPDSQGRQRGQDIAGHPQNHRQKWSKMRGQSKKRADRGLREEKILDRKTVLLQYLREILESNDSVVSSAVQKAKGFYRSCLDTRPIATAGAQPFLTLVQKLGGWAVSGQWNQSNLNTTLSLLMKDFATFPFFSVYVGRDPNETPHRISKKYIQIDQPNLLIPIDWNEMTHKSQAKTQTLRPFLAACERYLDLLGAPPSDSMIHVGAFISLSSELAVAASPRAYRLSKGQLYQRMTINELQRKAPAIDWLGCLRAAFHPAPLMEDDYVLLNNLPYIVQMSRIIGKWQNKHDPRSSGPLHTYMLLYLLHNLMPALDPRFSEAANNLSLALGNMRGQVTPRWKQCVLETERGFDLVLRHLLRERTAHAEAKEIIQTTLSSVMLKLHELSWTDQETPQFVLTKVRSLIPRLETTKEISTEAELDLLFSEVSVSAHSFFSSYVQLLAMWQKRHGRLLTEQNDGADVLSVTPSLLGNELLFPLGMFVPPLFHPTYPRAMNYGVLGFLIAKDILHLLLPDIYSQSETVRAVGECVWAHYLTVTEQAGRGEAPPLSAEQQQEVWVQHSALQIALQAYHQSLKDHPGDTSLSGLSHIHLFLTSFSQINCDLDPYRDFMPLEPSFLITPVCAKSHLCPTRVECPNRTRLHLLQRC